jgi:hypothetical protein
MNKAWLARVTVGSGVQPYPGPVGSVAGKPGITRPL